MLACAPGPLKFKHDVHCGARVQSLGKLVMNLMLYDISCKMLYMLSNKMMYFYSFRCSERGEYTQF